VATWVTVSSTPCEGSTRDLVRASRAEVRPAMVRGSG
jgi:hypothetical protein